MKTKENRGVYGPVALFVVGMLGICLFASNVADDRAAAAQIPDVVQTYQNCEYFGESAVMVQYSVWDYISTSCRDFDKPWKKKFEMEKGKTYDIETTRSATKGSYISKIIPSSE